jgi:hypothetical protein
MFAAAASGQSRTRNHIRAVFAPVAMLKMIAVFPFAAYTRGTPAIMAAC